MKYKEKQYQTALDIYFKKDAYTAGQVKEAVDIVIGDDGMRSKEVLEVVKKLGQLIDQKDERIKEMEKQLSDKPQARHN